MYNTTKNKIKPFGHFITLKKEKLMHEKLKQTFNEVHNTNKILLLPTTTIITNDENNIPDQTVYNFIEPVSNIISQFTNFPVLTPFGTENTQTQSHSSYVNNTFRGVLNGQLCKTHDTIQEQPNIESLFNKFNTIHYSIFENFVHDADYINKHPDEIHISEVYSRNIKMICNVYQEKYTQDNPATGFGDFLRGSYCLINFCEKYKLQCNIIINHPLSKLLNEHNTLNTNVSNEIIYFKNNNCDSHLTDTNNIIINNTNGNEIDSLIKKHLVKDVKVFNEGVVLMYTIAYPYHKIKESHRHIIRKIINPNYDMIKYITYTLNKLNLKYKQFMVIHLRTGDTYLNDQTINIDEYKLHNIFTEINEVISKNKNISDYLLITDNVNIRTKVVEKFGTIKTLFNEITHFGEGVAQYDEPIKNTLLEFYLMACSNKISSFTCYIHGTGFSKWCAETYNIPYTCKLIK